LNAMTEIQFADLFDLVEIQRIQDLFSDATGVASIITFPDGKPITRPSNFCRFCNEIIRKSDIGLSNCFKSDAEIGRPNPDGPVIQQCLSGGLWDAGASIIVDGKHIANWLIGQVRNDDLNDQKMLDYAKEIGADRNEFMKALDEVPVMSKDHFTKVAKMLYGFVNEISSKAYKNNQLFRTIEELKIAEEKLLKSELLNSTLIKHLPLRIFVKDPESKYILCNDVYSRDLSIDPKEIVGKNDFDFFQRELAEKYRADDQKVISEGIQKEDEEKYSIANQQRWTHVIKVPYRDSNDNIIGVLGIFEDITERKLRQEEIILKNDLLQTMNAEKDKFFSIIAHDLRSPLSAFVSTTQMLSEEIQTMNIEEIKKVAMNLSASAKNIYSLLENLLEWSMFRRDGLDFVPERLNLAQKVKECLDILNEYAINKDILISVSVPDNLEILVDKHMFDTILRNLVSNAIKFAPHGANVLISALLKENRTIEVKVTDTGIGMSPEILSKLFLLDQQICRKGTNGEPSTGLGLMLCKEFIEKNGGRISVESEVGKGSIFSFTIMQFHDDMI
jgi:PAS domain S-box-containing protein